MKRFALLKKKVFSQDRKSLVHSFAFSGCGWLTPFHFGVIDKMTEVGYITEKSIFAGTSGGSIAALSACANIKPRDALELTISMARMKGALNNVDRDMKQRLLSLCDDSTVAKCNNKLFVTITEILPGNFKFKGRIISTFENNNQLVDVVGASCFIPYYSDRRFTTKIDGFNGKYLDGGILHFMPPIGDIRVTPFPYTTALSKHLMPRPPHINLPKTYSAHTLVYWSLNPPSTDILKNLFEEGRKAAERYVIEQSKTTHQ